MNPSLNLNIFQTKPEYIFEYRFGRFSHFSEGCNTGIVKAVRVPLLFRMVDSEMFGHAIVEVLTLDGIFVVVEPVHPVLPP